MYLVRWKEIVKTRFGETHKEDERTGLVHTGVQYAMTLRALFRTDVL
jgi:hypothetical protein